MKSLPMLQRARNSCPVRKDSVSAWVEDISTAWARGAAGTLELARIVAAARADLNYGEWTQLWRTEDVPFSKRKAEMLVVIGGAVEGLDAQNSAHLPVAWNTLYYLARLGTSLMTRLIDDGRIHPDLSLRAAQQLLAEFRPRRSQRNPLLEIKRRLSRFAEFVRNTLPTWSARERLLVRTELSRLVDELALSRRLLAREPRSNRDHESLEAGADLRRFVTDSL